MKLFKTSTQKIIKKVRDEKLTYLENKALQDISDVVKRIDKQKIPGELIETGCALGGSAIVIASAKRKNQQFKVYDVFGMIPPPSKKDGKDIQDRYKVIVSGESEGIDGDKYYGYENNLKQRVQDSFEKFGFNIKDNNIDLVQGLYEETLTKQDDKNQKVAFAHIDCDWYDSVMTCLESIVPRLSIGGTLVIDDYDAWSGCREAIDDYFADKKNNFRFIKLSRLHITRTAN